MQPAGKPGKTAEETATEPRSGVLSTVVGVLPRWVRVALGVLGALALLFAAMWLVNQLRAMRLRRQSKVLRQDAGLMKRTLLTGTRHRVGPLVCSIASEQAEDAATAQGFHDVFELGDNKAGIIIGQVSHPGPAPLAQAALVRHRLRAHLELGLPPRSAIRRADELREDDLDAGAASATVAVYDGARGSLTYSFVGHPTPLVFGLEPGALAPVANFSPPMGTGSECGNRQTLISLPPGSTACLFSDGLRWRHEGREAIDREALSGVDELGEGAAEALVGGLRAHRGPGSGDIIVCLVRAAVAGIAPPKHVEELVLAPEDTVAAHAFLIACGLPPREAAELAGGAVESAKTTGHALLRVTSGADGPETEIVTYRRDSEWPARPAAALAHA